MAAALALHCRLHPFAQHTAAMHTKIVPQRHRDNVARYIITMQLIKEYNEQLKEVFH